MKRLFQNRVTHSSGAWKFWTRRRAAARRGTGSGGGDRQGAPTSRYHDVGWCVFSRGDGGSTQARATCLQAAGSAGFSGKNLKATSQEAKAEVSAIPRPDAEAKGAPIALWSRRFLQNLSDRSMQGLSRERHLKVMIDRARFTACFRLYPTTMTVSPGLSRFREACFDFPRAGRIPRKSKSALFAHFPRSSQRSSKRRAAERAAHADAPDSHR